MPRQILCVCFITTLACSQTASEGAAPPIAAPTNALRERQTATAAEPHNTSPGHDEHPQHQGHVHNALPAANFLPDTSLYNLPATLTDQAGRSLQFDELRGRPLLMTMFYASCTSICPMLIGYLQRVEQALSDDTRGRLQLLLVSLDPERDSVERLQALAAQHGVDGQRWHFARTPAASVQEIAALLGVRYRTMPSGEISHSPVVVLLDQAGVITARVEAPLGDASELARKLDAVYAQSVAGEHAAMIHDP